MLSWLNALLAVVMAAWLDCGLARSLNVWMTALEYLKGFTSSDPTLRNRSVTVIKHRNFLKDLWKIRWKI